MPTTANTSSPAAVSFGCCMSAVVLPTCPVSLVAEFGKGIAGARCRILLLLHDRGLICQEVLDNPPVDPQNAILSIVRLLDRT